MSVEFLKSRIFALMAVAMFAITVVYIIYVQQPTLCEKTPLADPGSAFHVDEILSETEVRQELPDFKNVIGITLRLATFARTNTGVLNVCIKDEETGRILYSEELNENEVRDNAKRAFYFRQPIEFSGRTALYLRGGKGCGPGNAITCWGHGRGTEGLMKNGQRIAGCLDYSLLVNEKKDCTYLLCFWGVLAFVLCLLKDRVLLEGVQHPERLFLFIGLASALAICHFTPQVYVMDACWHIMRVYQVSKGYFLPKNGLAATPAEERWREAVVAQHELPRNCGALSALNKTEPLRGIDFDCGSIVQRHGADSYTPLAYAYAAVFAKLARIMRLSLSDGILLISMGCIFAYIFLVYFILRKVTYYKWQLFLLALFPQILWQGISYSADAFCILGAFFLFADVVILRDRVEPFSWRNLLPLAVLSIVFCQCKIVYFPMLAMLLFLPADKFSSRRAYWGYFLLVSFLAGFGGLLWWKVSSVSDGSVDGLTLVEKVKFIAYHPLEYFKLWVFNFYGRPTCFSMSTFLSYKQFLWPDYHVYFQVFFFGSFILLREKSWSIFNRLLAALVFVLCVGLIDSAMYIYFSSDFGGVQLRYFAPLMPLFCIVFGQGRWGLPEKYVSYYKGALVIFAMLTQVVVVETSRQGYWM